MPNVHTNADWLSRIEAARRLGIGRTGLDRLVEQDLLTVKRLPGLAPQYRRADVERLLEASIHKPSRSPESGAVAVA